MDDATIAAIGGILGTAIASFFAWFATRKTNAVSTQQTDLRDLFTDQAIELQTAKEQIEKLAENASKHDVERARQEGQIDLLTKLLQSEREARYQENVQRIKEFEEQKQKMATMQGELNNLRDELHTVTHANGELARQVSDCEQRVNVMTDFAKNEGSGGGTIESRVRRGE